MALDMIRSIKEAEAEADGIVKDAQAKARQILKDATNLAYRTVSNQEEISRQETEKAVLAGKESAEGECREILSMAEREISALKQLSSAKTEKAVKLIVNRLGE